jgi:hypothetical protein
MSSSYIGSDVLSAPFSGATVPGFDILNPAQYFPNAKQIVDGTSGSSSSSSGSSTTTTPTTTTSTTTTPSSTTPSTSTSATSTENPYQKAYNSLESWVNQTLLQSITNPSSSSLPVYAGGSSAQLFAQLQTTLAAIQPGLQSGLYGNAGPQTSSTANGSATSTSVDNLA